MYNVKCTFLCLIFIIVRKYIVLGTLYFLQKSYPKIPNKSASLTIKKSFPSSFNSDPEYFP